MRGSITHSVAVRSFSRQGKGDAAGHIKDMQVGELSVASSQECLA